jgi:hypothetical protein
MENNVGFGLVPEINEESFVVEERTKLEPVKMV